MELSKGFLDDRNFLTPTQNNILKVLEETGPLTRKDIVKHLSTPRTTIYDNLLKLQKRKLVEKSTKNNGKRGRPIVLWRITPILT